MELNDKQLKGLELVGKAIKKKYPSIKDIRLDNGYNTQEYKNVLFLSIYLDFKELGDKYKLEVEPYHERIISNTLGPWYYSDSMTTEEISNFFYDWRKELGDTLNLYYKQLPDELVKKQKPFDWSDSEYHIDLVPFDYYDTNQPIPYSEYVKFLTDKKKYY